MLLKFTRQVAELAYEHKLIYELLPLAGIIAPEVHQVRLRSSAIRGRSVGSGFKQARRVQARPVISSTGQAS
jgi:hypothetical protein